MKIHEFLSLHRDEVCDACVLNLRQQASPARPDEELVQDIRGFVEQVSHWMRRSDGVDGGAASTPDLCAAAALVGHKVHSKGLSIQNVARRFATLPVSLGEVGARYHLAFDAGEYAALNKAIDDSVVAAVEQFTNDVSAEHEHAATERAGFMAHELRNAMTSAKMAFGALERETTTDGWARPTIRRSLRRMEKIIEQSLLEVRLSEAPMPALRPLRIAPLLHDIATDCVLERAVRVDVEADEALTAMADEELFAVAVGNLAQNAIKSTGDGTVVCIRARAEPDAVVVEVEDECGGLPASVLHEDLFKPFVKARPDGHGLGLGLAITRRAAEALLAKVTARDLPGKGCVFTLHLRPG